MKALVIALPGAAAGAASFAAPCLRQLDWKVARENSSSVKTPSWLVSSCSKIFRAAASCAFALSAGDVVADGEGVVVLDEPEGVVAEGVLAGAAVDGVVVEVVGAIVADEGADGDVCVTVAPSAEDVDAVSDVVAHAVPAAARTEQVATAASCRK